MLEDQKLFFKKYLSDIISDKCHRARVLLNTINSVISPSPITHFPVFSATCENFLQFCQWGCCYQVSEHSSSLWSFCYLRFFSCFQSLWARFSVQFGWTGLPFKALYVSPQHYILSSLKKTNVDAAALSYFGPMSKLLEKVLEKIAFRKKKQKKSDSQKISLFSVVAAIREEVQMSVWKSHHLCWQSGRRSPAHSKELTPLFPSVS